MRLEELCADLPGARIEGEGNCEISGLCYDSRAASPGDLFVAVEGTVSHGNQYVEEALKRGAAAVLTDRPLEPS
ncbi:MAG: Mur ligase domain-containing protein, partial [Planctomycetota bacterium]